MELLILGVLFSGISPSQVLRGVKYHAALEKK